MELLYTTNREEIRKIVDLSKQVLSEFVALFNSHLNQSHSGIFTFEVDTISSLETAIDDTIYDMKRNIQKSLKLSSTNDYLTLFDTFDTIIDTIAHLSSALKLKKLSAHSELIPLYRELLAAIETSVNRSLDLTNKLLTPFKKEELFLDIESIGQAETDADTIEDKLIERLFSQSCTLTEKIEESAVIHELAAIGNNCEHFANHLGIVNFKTAE